MTKAVLGRGPSKEATRRALLGAALEEFGEHGFDLPSLDAICARAGFTRGAFYVHFSNREELMVAVIEYAMGEFIDAVIAQGDAAGDLERTIERFATAVAGARGSDGPRGAAALPLTASVPFARVLDALSRSPRLLGGFTATLRDAATRLGDVVRHGQAQGHVRRDVDPAQLAFLLMMIALGTLVALDVRAPMDPPAAAAAVRTLLDPGG